jgi:GNAT superfamily N-acetyltransferase
MIEITALRTSPDRKAFLSFPWRLYRHDPLWVPPLYSERKKAIDPQRGAFFKDGDAEFFVARKNGKAAGTICCAEEYTVTKSKGRPECMIGFFECIEDYDVAAALFRHAEEWACLRGMKSMYGTFNLDREDGRGVLIEGYDRPAAILCGHNPSYYAGFFERFGFKIDFDDGLAYAVDLDPTSPRIQRLGRLAERVRQKKDIRVRSANMQDVEHEIDHIWDLQNRGLEHLEGFTPYSRENIEAMVLPLKDLADPDLVLFAEVGGQVVGWFPAVPNYNEVLIHLNGLRYPWDYLRAAWYTRQRPKGIAIKSAAVLPEYWDTGVGILLFDEMARRAMAKGYKWADASLTGEENPDTYNICHHLGAKIYKRYRFYRKDL